MWGENLGLVMGFGITQTRLGLHAKFRITQNSHVAQTGLELHKLPLEDTLHKQVSVLVAEAVVVVIAIEIVVMIVIPAEVGNVKAAGVKAIEVVVVTEQWNG